MPTKIKKDLVKTLILRILGYPRIPTHALTKPQLGKLKIVQNKALRFAANQRYPYTLNTEQIHTITKTLPINVRLHQKAEKIWQKLESLQKGTLTTLRENQRSINHYQKAFPSSLHSLNEPPAPLFH